MAKASISITNMAEFNAQLVKVMKKVESGLEDRVLKKVVFDGHRNLQKRTPRKTGRARAGWNTTVDAAPSEWKPPEGAAHYANTPFRGGEMIKFNSIVNLSNNVEYIVPLDQGHSKQADNIVPYVFAQMTAHLNSVLAAENRKKYQ